ncbi:hypothetical protein F4801DRAFT_576510 [Xylaria longipes]|nr:hypothetical protein F4801DRAFT_576510 [Xylaria longipes]
MAAPRDRPYRHLGVFIPFSALAGNLQWSSEENIERDGFIYLHQLKADIFSVQSISTGDYVDDGPNFVPEELRFSTAPRAERRLPRPGIVRGRTRIYFIELDLWQDFGHGVHSLYFKHYNGGALDRFVQLYNRRDREVPEHFIWHVLLTLVEAVRYLKFGALPGTDDEDPNWIPIHHRDIAARNVFIHYPPRDDAEPDEGFEENAFPEIILGDFGHAAMDGDDLASVKPGCWDQQGVIADWHDTYSIFDTAKSLCTKMDHGVARHINDILEEGERPYSDTLIQMFGFFEYPNYEYEEDIRDSQLDPISGLMESNYSNIPSMREVVEDFLPIIRREVKRYRDRAGGIPDGWWKQLDVSWTKPDPFMPYEWMTQGLPGANDAKIQGGGGDKGDQDKDNGKDKDDREDGEDDEDDEDDENDKENEAPDNKPLKSHRCPRPNPESVRKMVGGLVKLAKDYGNERPAHQIVHLDYGQPIMTELREPPPPPAPLPPPLAPSPPNTP